jgi:hypothetical protein
MVLQYSPDKLPSVKVAYIVFNLAKHRLKIKIELAKHRLKIKMRDKTQKL